MTRAGGVGVGRGVGVVGVVVIVVVAASVALTGCPQRVDLRDRRIAVAADVLGDGGSSGTLIVVDGTAFVGPRADGAGVVRITEDGDDGADGPDVIAFDLVVDGAAVPVSLGSPGCTDTACGPDGEDGPLTLWSTGAEVLVGGRSSGDLGVVYVADVDASDDRWAFAALELDGALQGRPRAPSALTRHGDDVIVGFAHDGGGPDLLALTALTGGAPALSACDDQEDKEEADVGCDLRGGGLPGLRGGSSAVVDALASFGGALFVANGAGVVRSVGPALLAAPSGFTDVTPTGFLDVDPLPVTALSRTRPRARAVAALVVAADALWLAENTIGGPRLWRCATPCDVDDWRELALVDDGDAGAIGALVPVRDGLLVLSDDGDGAFTQRVVDDGAGPGVGPELGAPVALDIDRVDAAVLDPAAGDDADLLVLGASDDGALQLLRVPAIVWR